MKLDLFVMGIYRGQVEVGEASLVARLAHGDWQEAARVAGELQRALDELTGRREDNGSREGGAPCN